jgi:hypothetical protein
VKKKLLLPFQFIHISFYLNYIKEIIIDIKLTLLGIQRLNEKITQFCSMLILIQINMNSSQKKFYLFQNMSK